MSPFEVSVLASLSGAIYQYPPVPRRGVWLLGAPIWPVPPPPAARARFHPGPHRVAPLGIESAEAPSYRDQVSRHWQRIRARAVLGLTGRGAPARRPDATLSP